MSESLQRGRRAVRRIVVPGLVIVCIVVLGSAGLLSYTAHSVDRVQVREERALVVRKIARALDGVVNDITSASVWDQAYENLGPDLDLHWADIELGHYYSKYFGHALSVVLDPHDTPVYAWRGEQRVEPASTTAFVRAAGPLVVRLRAQERRAGERAGPAPVGFPAVTTASGVVEAEGGLYIVGASTIVRETTEVELRPGPGSIVLSAKRIDPAFLASFENDLGVSNAAIKPPGAQSDAVSAAVIDINGRAVADLVWTPSRSGLAVLRAAIPVFLTGLLVLALAGLALAARIRAILADLAANDATLDEAMAELVRARDQAQSANIAKSQFLANMSHEIRTPLNGVLGMAHVMSRDTLEPAQRARLDVIQHSGETLLTILNDVLDISKIEAGKLELDNHEFVLDEALQAACDTFASLAAQKKVGFRVVVADEAHGLWFGDSVRLRQVLMNLVSNAVKFTARGEVEVRVERTDKGLWFQVRDSGIGIPEERMADLFQKFSQVDATTTRKFGGTGLGLAICHELVALMGGEFDVESEAQVGSRFTFALPFEKIVGPPRRKAVVAEPEAGGLGPLHILAAEDNQTNQLILQSLLEPLGVTLTVVGNGREAMQAFERDRFDLVLMDIQMPEVNGVEASVAIRALEMKEGRARTPILALSANVMSHQIREYLDAGMCGFVSKPIKAADLVGAIQAAIEPAQDAELRMEDDDARPRVGSGRV